MNLPIRFWTKVEKTDSCWKWTAPLNRYGYGRLKIGGMTRYAHQLAWEYFNGRSRLPGKFICHRCDNRSCVNPKHLYEGTPSSNMQDMWDRKRHPGTNLIGEKHPRCVLTATLVLAMREEKRNGVRVCDIVDRYGFSRSAVDHALRGRTWKHITKGASQ